jgi:ADP-heptose:LPS heptosyltransferase
MSKKMIRILTVGGFGDMLLTTPAIAMLKKKFPASKIVMYCIKPAYGDIFINNPNVDKITDISFWHNPWAYTLYYFKRSKFYTHHYGRLFPSLYYRSTPAQEIIANGFKVQLESRQVQIFLTAKEDAAAKALMAKHTNPVVIHIGTFTTPNKEWPIENWQSLVESMPGCTFIQIGLTIEPQLKQAVDLRGKHSFREFMALIKYAKAFTGVDSAFSHVTNAFNIPGVILFGPSEPRIWGHPNNINIYKNLRYSPCIDLLKDVCPYGKPCMTDITVDEVREALMRQLNKNKVTETNGVEYAI